LPPFSAIEIYGRIERNYTPRRLADVPVSLVHASAGEGNDRPLQVLYSDRALGWEAYTDHLEIVQVPGGHASMFQEQNAEHLARVLLERMQEASLTDQSHRDKESKSLVA
jgi:thioesterase domain-containing protein